VDGLAMNDYAFDINHPFDPLAMKDRVLALLQARREVSCHLVERSSAFRQELDGYFATLEERLAVPKGR
jgi:hypothetical protein